MRIQFFLGSKEFDKHFNQSIPTPPNPEPLANGANEEVKKYTTAYQEFEEWKKADVEVHRCVLSTLPGSLLIKTAATLWGILCSELSSTGELVEDADYASILTNSLPESYGNVVSTAYTKY